MRTENYLKFGKDAILKEYTKIPNALINSAELTDSEFRFMANILSVENSVKLTLKGIAEKMNISKCSVIRHISNLKAKGILLNVEDGFFVDLRKFQNEPIIADVPVAAPVIPEPIKSVPEPVIKIEKNLIGKITESNINNIHKAFNKYSKLEEEKMTFNQFFKVVLWTTIFESKSYQLDVINQHLIQYDPEIFGWSGAISQMLQYILSNKIDINKEMLQLN